MFCTSGFPRFPRGFPGFLEITNFTLNRLKGKPIALSQAEHYCRKFVKKRGEEKHWQKPSPPSSTWNWWLKPPGKCVSSLGGGRISKRRIVLGEVPPAHSQWKVKFQIDILDWDPLIRVCQTVCSIICWNCDNYHPNIYYIVLYYIIYISWFVKPLSTRTASIELPGSLWKAVLPIPSDVDAEPPWCPSNFKPSNWKPLDNSLMKRSKV